MLRLAHFTICLLISVSAIDPLDLSGCGTTKGCVTSPKDCKTDCQMAFTFHTDSSGETTLEMYSKLLANGGKPLSGSGNQYVAIGFSNDRFMGDDTVIQCSHSEFEVGEPTDGIEFLNKVALSKNVGKNNQYIGALAGIDEEHSYTGDGLLCRIRGQKLTLDSFENDGQQYPLSGQKYILLTTGIVTDPKQGTQVNQHTLTTSSPEFPVVSETKVEIFEDFNSMTTTEPELQTTTKSGFWPKSGWAGLMVMGFVLAAVLL